MRYPGLDLLRGIAAFGIVGCHLGLLPTTAAGMLLLHFTDTNVAIFGTVSGFLMTASVEKKSVEITSFVKSRCRRLLPAYFFWTVVFEELLSSDRLFARKFSSAHADVVQALYDRLRV